MCGLNRIVYEVYRMNLTLKIEEIFIGETRNQPQVFPYRVIFFSHQCNLIFIQLHYVMVKMSSS
jgi:hypothetical protein